MQQPPRHPYRQPPNNLEHRLRRYLRQFEAWYRVQSKKMKLAVAIGIILAVCAFYGTAGAVIVSNSTVQATPTDTPTQAAILVATATDTQALPTPTEAQPKPTPKPTPRPTPTQVRPTPTPTQQSGVNGNPWGYDFSPGGYIYNPPADFCSYFNCIASFWNGHGFVNECQDGSYSLSGGIRGDCSSHGGEMRPLYSH